MFHLALGDRIPRDHRVLNGNFACAHHHHCLHPANCGSLQPEWNLTQRYSFVFDETYTLSLRHRYLSGFEQEPDDIINGNGPAFQGTSPLFGQVDFQKISAEHYFDLSFQWDVSDNVLFTLTAQNLFDNQPGIVGSNIGSTGFNSGNVFPSTHDALGRRYGASVKFTF
jgi:outer membrane receptor protein involved in Fe transport